MSWLQRFRRLKRRTPEQTVIAYDWQTKEMSCRGNVHPFVTVRADMIKSQVKYAENLFSMYVNFMAGLHQIYGKDFVNLVRKKFNTEIVKDQDLSAEDAKELNRMMSVLAQRSESDEEQFDRRRIKQFCMMLED